MAHIRKLITSSLAVKVNLLKIYEKGEKNKQYKAQELGREHLKGSSGGLTD